MIGLIIESPLPRTQIFALWSNNDCSGKRVLCGPPIIIGISESISRISFAIDLEIFCSCG